MFTSIINGEAQTGPTTLTAANPANLDDVLGEASLVDGAAFAGAAADAATAQREWAAVPAPIRGVAIHRLGVLFEDNKQALAELVTREIGKPLPESLGEVQEAIDTCIFFASEGRRLYGQTVPSEMPAKHLSTYRVPVGTMAIVTAGNFPVAVPSWYVVPALVAGNAVVWKPAEYTPAIAEAFTRLVHAAGIPPSVFQMVLADGPATSDGLEQALEAGSLHKVGFTGSSTVGRRIAELCGRHLVSPTLELGGKNPLVVMPDADLDLAVEGALFSGFGTAGQRCTSLGILVLHEQIADEFLSRFTAAVESAAIGDPTQDVLYGPMISERFAVNFEKWLQEIEDHHTVAGSTGVGRITADNPREGFVGDPTIGIFDHPTIVSGVTRDDALYRNETFGPIVPVTTAVDFDDAVELANGHGYGLSSSIYTTDPATAFSFREQVSAGMLSINNSTSGAEAHLPFGGNGKSGNGARQSGIWVLDQVTRWQSTNWDWSGQLQKAQMDVATVEADMDFRL
ncbi:aldehyde dehydrogenase family protein [Salsipaludibacter albus]|uniref:aldehyde dehydrogenase family protein n=1 Tax=Salsipaludibacter albus TaxID=2849650 RepID=UPI001EE3F667|nr:aldehyde dehydrogenase family protein [Salsipaludibacter albus]MBY5161622.1 aldehyde dehydrogenase family protein [Salsipaludibacter albus]